MLIGINAQAAIKQPRTGVEEYTYQLVKHLTMLPEAREHRFLLYMPSEALAKEDLPGVPIFDFPLPANFEIKILRWPLPFLWTQIRLAWEMLRRSPDILFIPVHVLPFFSPKRSTVVLHGLEYEYFSEYYSWWRRWYLRWSTKQAAKRAKKIVAISANTKDDLIKRYKIDSTKIRVIHHGVSVKDKLLTADSICQTKKPYLLYLGRLETKKNVQGILEAYRILKEEYGVPHNLVLAGSPGYGYKNLKHKIENLKLKVTELGYVSEEEKWRLLSDAEVFLFPSFYEGFGLPVLEAQAAGAPVITSFSSCLPEIAGAGAVFVNPKNSAQIAEAIKRVIDDDVLRDRLIQLGKENVKRFNWEKCAVEALQILVKI